MFHAHRNEAQTAPYSDVTVAGEEFPAQVHYLPPLPPFSPKVTLDNIFDDDTLIIDAPVPDESLNTSDTVMSNTDVEPILLPPPTRYPTGEDWTAYRPAISRLYIEENRTLSEVMAIMEASYGFNGTIKMYKKRITEWQLFKNYKAAEKEQMPRKLEAFKQSGIEHNQLTIRGAPVKLHRIDRHQRERNCVISPALDNNAGFDSNQITNSNTGKTRRKKTLLRRWDSRAEKRAQAQRRLSILPHPSSRIPDLPEHRDANSLLWHIESYFNWKLGDNPIVAWDTWTGSFESQSPVSLSYVFQEQKFECVFSNPSDIFERVQCALTCLKMNAHHAAWRMINEGAAMVRACLEREPPKLLQYLWWLYTSDDRASHLEIQNHFLRQLFNMASIVHGELHPITIICRTLLPPQTRSHLAELAQIKTSDVLERRLHEHHDDVLRSRLEICCSLICHEKYDEAERLLRKFIKLCERLQGRDSYNTRCGLIELGQCLLLHCRLSEAEEMLLDTLERGKDLGVDYGKTFADLVMGTLYAEQGQYDVAEYHLWKALSGSLLRFGPRNPLTLRNWAAYQVTMERAREVGGAEEAEMQDLHSLEDHIEDESRSQRNPRLRSKSVDRRQVSDRGRGLERDRIRHSDERGSSCSIADLCEEDYGKGIDQEQMV